MEYKNSQVKASVKWDRANRKNGTYKMDIPIFDAFEKYCQDNGTNRNKVINDFVFKLLSDNGYI